MNSRKLAVLGILVGAGLLWAPEVVAQKNQAVEGPKTVIGPRNPWLASGARAIQDGNPQRGVELTEIGLANAQGGYERKAALSNLCAGYLMLNRYDEALGYCNQAIEADPEHWRALSNRALIHIFRREFDLAAEDIGRAQSIAPRARIPRQVRAMLRDAVDPVMPTVTIDDRRRPAASEAAD